MNTKKIRRENVFALLDERYAGNKAAFARAIDRPAPNVHRMLVMPSDDQKDRRGIGEDLARDIEKKLGLNAGWLDVPHYLTGTTDTCYAVNVQPTDAERQQYPLISWVQAGAWREIVDAYPRGWGESMVFAQNQHGGLTFALKVMGDSMEPEFREGDVIFVDPDKEPKAGSYVVAKNHEEEATFKKYRSRGKDAEGREVFELVPLNENYATLRSDQEPITIIGVVVEHTRVFKV